MTPRAAVTLFALALAGGACKGDPAEAAGETSGASTTADDAPASSDEVGSSEGTQGTADSGLPGGMGCCEPHDTPGCEEPEVRSCTCAIDPVCCASEWDEGCVNVAMVNCMPTCMPGSATMHGDTSASVGTGESGPSDESSSSGDGDAESDDESGEASTGDPGDEGACCTITPGEAGCPDEAIENCVCELDEYCCNNQWDYLCVQQAASPCGSVCMDDCCETHDHPGCLQSDVTMCVCDFDDFCCNQEWDQQCLDEAMQQCDLAC